MSATIFARIRGRLARYAETILDWLRIRAATRHLSGPRQVTLEDDQVALVCLQKDAAYYLDSFLDHHRRLGVSHFLLIDNGSQDDTIAKAARHPDITVISNRLPVADYECLLRAQIARRVVRGGWLLFADSDELIEMAHGEGRRIGQMTAYCNRHGYDAVVGQVLDLYADAPLSETARWSYADSVAAFDRYSLRDISRFDYHDGENVEYAWFLKDNRVSNPDIKIMFGGIRKEVFGENCALTTHRLVRNSPGIRIYSHPHCCSGVSCADFTLLIRHYKFAGAYLQREKAQLAQKTWAHREGETRMAVIAGRADFAISGRQERVYTGTAQLVQEGFLACSDRYLAQFPALRPPSRDAHRRATRRRAAGG